MSVLLPGVFILLPGGPLYHKACQILLQNAVFGVVGIWTFLGLNGVVVV